VLLDLRNYLNITIFICIKKIDKRRGNGHV
jgi:hypothetical protein